MSRYTLLIASCNPPEARPLQVERIVRKIQNIFTDTFINIEQSPDLHFADLEGLLKRHRPALFQFVGHGQPDGRLVMKRQSEKAEDVSAEAVVGVMKQAPELPRVVVLTACFTESLADQLVKAGIPCVIGTLDRTPDESLEAFSTAFYRALAEKCSVGEAFRSGKAAVAGETEGQENLFCLREGTPGAADALRFGPPEIAIERVPATAPARSSSGWTSTRSSPARRRSSSICPLSARASGSGSG